MKTVLITGPATMAISLESAKEHLIVTHSDDDQYINALIVAAVGHIEQITWRKLISQTWKVLFDGWPIDAEIVLPFGQCSAVNSVKYTDSDSVVTTWDTSNYIVDTDSIPARVVIGYDKSWPTDNLLHVNPIAVELVSGYGTTADKVPAQLQHAIKLLVSHWYENREIVVVGSIVAKLPVAVDALIWPYRLFGF